MSACTKRVARDILVQADAAHLAAVCNNLASPCLVPCIDTAAVPMNPLYEMLHDNKLSAKAWSMHILPNTTRPWVTSDT